MLDNAKFKLIKLSSNSIMEIHPVNLSRKISPLNHSNFPKVLMYENEIKTGHVYSQIKSQRVSVM